MRTEFTKTIFRPNGMQTGYWERKDGSEGGELAIDQNEVIDFDGCHDLPGYVKTDLASHGISCNW
jgi:hypothetical protein